MKNKNLRGNLFTKTALSPSEATISKMIEQFLTAKGLYNDRLNSGKIFIKSKYYRKKTNDFAESSRVVILCKAGTPDRFFIVKGKIYYIETKILNETPTPEQLARHAELRDAGAVVLVVDSFDGFLEQFGKLEFETKTTEKAV